MAGSYTGQTPNNAFCVLDSALATSDQGRGFQLTDADGVVAFDTCFPGWYPGRAIHFHFAVRDGDTTLGVSQLFFPEDLTSGIFASHPDYSLFGQPDTPWSRDGVIRGMPEADRPRHTLDIARMSDGAMLASKTLVLPWNIDSMRVFCRAAVRFGVVAGFGNRVRIWGAAGREARVWGAAGCEARVWHLRQGLGMHESLAYSAANFGARQVRPFETPATSR